MKRKKIPESISALSQEFVDKVSLLYGARLNKVILFGSYARGEQHQDSDVDYLVVLNDEDVQSYTEIGQLSPTTFELSLKYLLSVSAVPVSKSRFDNNGSPLMKNVRKDGIVL